MKRSILLIALASCSETVDLQPWGSPNPHGTFIYPFEAPAVVIDVRDKTVTLDDFLAWEAEHGRVPDDAAILFRSGRSCSLSLDLADRLVRHRQVAALVFDGVADLSVEVVKLLRRSRIQVLRVCDMSRLPSTGATLIVAHEWEGVLTLPYAVFARIPATAEKPRPRKTARVRIIEFGWDIPDTKTLRENIAEMERMPFDGVVIDPERMSWKVFGKDRIPEAWVERSVADLRATEFEWFTDNFLRVNVTPGVLDDREAILHNARLAARLARQGGLKGWFFDTEAYEKPVWDESELESLGRRMRDVIDEEYPEMTILLSFGYGIYPGLDAFLKGLGPRGVIDGYENSYGFKSERAFERARVAVERTGLKVGFGIWLDFESGRRGRGDWFTPREFEDAVRHARAHSDGYVWIYSERLNWWTGENLREEYRRALERARR